MKLRKLADQTGWSIADIMHDLMEEYVARHKAEGNEKRKLFDSRNAKSARNRRFKFQKRTQLFIRTDNEALLIAAMRVGNEASSPLRTHG